MVGKVYQRSIMSRRKTAKENNRGAGDAGGLFDLVEDVTIRGEAVEGESHKEFITGGVVDKPQERLRDREVRQAAVCLEAGSDAEVGHPPTMARTHAGETAQEGGEEVFPEAAGLRPQAGMDNVSTLIPPTGGKKQRTTVHVSIEVMERIRNAVYWTPGLTLAAVAEEAFRKALVELEGQRGGVPFASRPTGLKGGRPLK
jgi:hypothetical protein